MGSVAWVAAREGEPPTNGLAAAMHPAAFKKTRRLMEPVVSVVNLFIEIFFLPLVFYLVLPPFSVVPSIVSRSIDRIYGRFLGHEFCRHNGPK
jgi:hypothetical protein